MHRCRNEKFNFHTRLATTDEQFSKMMASCPSIREECATLGVTPSQHFINFIAAWPQGEGKEWCVKHGPVGKYPKTYKVLDANLDANLWPLDDSLSDTCESSNSEVSHLWYQVGPGFCMQNGCFLYALCVNGLSNILHVEALQARCILVFDILGGFGFFRLSWGSFCGVSNWSRGTFFLYAISVISIGSGPFRTFRRLIWTYSTVWIVVPCWAFRQHSSSQSSRTGFM